MLDLRVRLHGVFPIVVAGYLLGATTVAYAQDTYVSTTATFTPPSPYQSQLYSAPQIYSGAQVERYLGPQGMTQVTPAPLFATDLGPAAGRFPLVQSQPLYQQTPQFRTQPLVEFYTPSPVQPAPQPQQPQTAIPLPGAMIERGAVIQGQPGTGATQPQSGALVLQGGAMEEIPSRTDPIQIITLPNQPPILVPMETGAATADGGGSASMATTPPAEIQAAGGGSQAGQGTEQTTPSGDATATATERQASAGEGGAAASGTPLAETDAGQGQDEAQVESGSKVAHAESHDDEHDEYKKKREKEEEYASTLRAMENMSQAQREANAHLGFKAIDDPTGEHTGVRNQQIMGGAVMAQIEQLSAGMQNNKVMQAALPSAIEVKIDEAAIKREIAKERKRIEDEKRRLKNEADKERKRLKKEKQKADKEKQRREKDKKYKERRAREEQQKKTAEDLNKQNKDLKERAEKLDKWQKDLDKFDKDLREQEQRARANDPNCQGDECRAIREQRSWVNAERTKAMKDQTQLQKDAQSFNNKVREWQSDQRELEDLKDRGFGMNEEERAERRAEQRLDAAKENLRDIERQKADLKRQAKWLEAEGELDEDAADNLRKQWNALEEAEQKATRGMWSAEADLLEKQARALGVGDVFDAAMKSYEPSFEGQRPTRPHNLPGLESAMDEARRYQNASDATLDKVSSLYGDALKQLDEIERKIGTDPSDPKNEPPVNGDLGGDYARTIDEYNRIAEELKKINPQGFMNSDEFKNARKASYEAGREMEKHQQRLEELGDSEPIGGNVTNLSPGEPATFRSQSELARRHSFSFTGPPSLQDEVMRERAALEKATADYLSAQDELSKIREGSAAYQKGQELWKRLDALDSQIDLMRPLADVNALSNDVLQFNTSIVTGLPRGADGQIDEQAVINNVRAMAQGQMGLLQNGVALDQAQRAAAANPNGKAEQQQLQALESQQRAIIQNLQEVGVTVDVKDGKFTPTVLSNGVGQMWDMARDQTIATLNQIEQNRKAAGVAGGGPTPPGEAGKGTVNAGLDREFNKADAERAEQNKVADLQPPPNPDAARSQGGDLDQLHSARRALESNINSIDATLAELPDNHPVAPGLIATRTGLEAAFKSVDGAIAKAEQTAGATTVRTQQLNQARQALETNINDIDTALAELPDSHPVVPGLVATRTGLEAALQGVDAAIVKAQPPKAEARAGTTQLNAARGALEKNINDLDTALAELPDNHPVVPGLTATRDGLEAALKGVDAAIVKADQKTQETVVRTQQLTKARAGLEKNINDIDGALAELPDNHPVAPGLIATRTGLEAALQGVDKALAEPALKREQARLHTDQLNAARDGLERNIADLDTALAELPENHPVVPGLTATRDSLEAALKGVDAAIVKSEAPKPDAKERTKQLTSAAAALEKNINGIDERLTEIDGWTPEAVALTATRNSLEAAYVGIDNALKEIAPETPQPAPREIESQQPQSGGTAPIVQVPVTLSPEVKAALTQNRDVLVEQIEGLDQQIVAVGAESAPGLALAQTRSAIKASVASIEKALEAPVKPDVVAAPQPVKIPATDAAGRQAASVQDREKVLSDRLNRIVQERLGINERLKSLPEDDPEAQKLRARSEQLSVAQDEIDKALGQLSGDQPAAGAAGFEAAARLEPEQQKTLAQALESHPELAEMRKQIFEKDQKGLTLTPGSAAWQANLAEREQMVARYVARYNALARERSGQAQPQQKPEQAAQPAQRDPAIAYLDWVDKDVLPALRGGVGVGGLRQALTGIAALLGAERAEEIVHNALDKTLEFGDGNNAEIFLDEVLTRAAGLARSEAGAAAGRSIDMARAQALSALLRDPAIERDQALKEELKARFGDIAKSLRDELGAAIANSANTPDTKIALLGELAALSALDGGDLAPLVTEYEQELARLAKSQLQTGAAGAERAQTLRRLAASLEALQAATPELADRLGKARLASIQLLQRQVSTLAQSASEEQAGALKRESAQLVLREAAALLGSGDPAAALERIRRAGTEKDLSPTDRDLALLSALDRVRNAWAVLDGNARAALGSLERLEQERDQALERLSQSADPALAAAASLLRSRAALARGDAAAARRLIDEAIRRQPGDPVLQGEKVRLSLGDPSQPVSPERIDQALAEVPEALRLPAGLLAIDSLMESGANAAALALIERLRGMTDATEDANALNAYLDARKAFALAGQPAGAVTSAQVREAIGRARESLVAAAGTNPALAGEIERLDALSKQLDQVEKLEKALAEGSAPVEGYPALAREALAMGRLDLAERALSRHVADLLDPNSIKDNATVLAGLRQSAALLEMVRRRAGQADLSPEQRALFDGFIGRIAPQLTGVIDQYIKEREPIARQAINRAATDPKAAATAAQRRNELRMLERLRWSVHAATLRPEQWLQHINEAEAAATRKVNDKLAEIRSRFGGLAKAVNEDATRSAELDKALAELDVLRAERDGITDFKLSFAPMAGYIDISQYGVLPPRTARDEAIREAQRNLISVDPGGDADDLWERRREARRQGGSYQAFGARERLLVEAGRAPSGSDLRNNPDKYKDYWLEMRITERDAAYYERRRAELVFEDPTRPGSAATELLNKLVGHEVAVLKGIVAPSNALSEMVQQISGYGANYRAAAGVLESQMPQNQVSGWLNDLELARQGGDVQKAFSSLVNLREASLSGELRAFVNYLDIPWYRAGPARAYNLVIGMTETQKALEAAIVETGRLNAVLIRAANNLPEALSAEDRTLLERHGFLKDGKYAIPEHVRVTPTTVASEFAQITQEGALGKVDQILNAAHVVELTATVAIPGGIAGRLGKTLATELTKAGVRTLVAQGIALTVETAAFTGLSRLSRVALDPELLTSREFWSGRAMLAEYGHNLLTLGVLKVKGAGLEKLGKSLERMPAGRLRSELEGVARSLDVVGEAALLTTLNGALGSNSISRETFFENLMVVSLLRATHVAGDAGKRALGIPTGQGTGNAGRSLAERTDARGAEVRYQQWLDAYYLPARRLMEQFNGDWAALRKAYQKKEISEEQMRRVVELRKAVVDSLYKEIVAELGGEVQAFGSTNLTSDYDISFVGPKAQLAVILFNARFGARWAAARDIGGRETGVTLDTNAYTGTEHLNYSGGKLDVWLQDSYAHLAARKYLSDAEWAAYRARVEEAGGPEKRGDIGKMLDKVETDFRGLREAIEAERARLKGTVPDSDINITAENRLYEKTLMEIADLVERYSAADAAGKEALAQDIRNAQSRALFYAQEAYNTQAAIQHVVTNIQAARRAITAESLLSKDPLELKVPMTPDQARQSFIEQIANMLKELSHGGDPEKLAGKAAKYFVRALDAARIAGIDLAQLEAIVRSTVEINDKRAELSDVKKVLEARYPEGGAEAYLKGVEDAVNALNRAFFGGAEARIAANDNAPAAGASAAQSQAATGGSAKSEPGEAAAGGGTPGEPPAPAASPTPPKPPADPNAETVLDTLPRAGSGSRTGSDTETPSFESVDNGARARAEGIAQLEGDPVFARWLDQPVSDAATRGQLETIGLLRGLLEPAERLEADRALATAEALVNTIPDLAGINLLEVARYVNLHAGRAPGESGVNARTPSAAQLAAEALLQINPTARITIRDLVAAARIDGAGARDALNGARSTLARQGGEVTDQTDALDRHPLTSFTAEPLILLNRIDGSYLVQRPRAGAPGDSEFFAVNDLLPRLTIDVGGQRYHVTEPFKGPDGRISVVAFQETSLGTLVPRTFYLSGEHGVWRAAIAMAGGLISKGPIRLTYRGQEITAEQMLEMRVTAETQFVNESAVDLGAEIQGTLSRWAADRGVRDLPRDVMERAFYGHLERNFALESGAEFSAFVNRADVERALTANENQLPERLLPDLATGPLDQWRVESHIYGELSGATYLSRDGSVIYVVLRDAQGRVFVPSIQDAKVGLTPFGTRWSSYRTGLNSTPMVHGARDYVANDNYQNSLNSLFR
jgi:DNA repair exonuclease SbcCD ATPase subunit